MHQVGQCTNSANNIPFIRPTLGQVSTSYLTHFRNNRAATIFLSTLTFQNSYLRSNHHERSECRLSDPPLKYFQPDKIGLAIIFCLAGAKPVYGTDIYWQIWAIDASGSGADGVHTGDINRDGLIDVVSGWEQSGDLRLYINPGPKGVRQTAAW